jgi:hypothetical protein
MHLETKIHAHHLRPYFVAAVNGQDEEGREREREREINKYIFVRIGKVEELLPFSFYIYFCTLQ